jgi:hypothetical protein
MWIKRYHLVSISVLVLAGSLAGCALAVAPIMVLGDDPHRPEWQRPGADMLGRPGRYSFLAKDATQPYATITIDQDLFFHLSTSGCVLDGVLLSDSTRHEGDALRFKGVYRITSSSGGCVAAPGAEVVVEPRQHNVDAESSQRAFYGNALAIKLRSPKSCCGTRPVPGLVFPEAWAVKREGLAGSS